MPVDSSGLLPVKDYTYTKEDKTRFASEMSLGMLNPSSPALNDIALAVEPGNIPLIANASDAMENAANGQRRSRGRSKRRTLVGLAAPQIGINLRIILVDTHVGPDRRNYGKLRYFINPEIIWRSKETEEGREGCFSAGPVWGLVRRPIAVKIRAFDRNGKPIEQVFEDFTARILQHEIDHLNGIRFPDRIRSDRKRHWVHTEELGVYASHIHHWPRTCSMAQWESVKNGLVLKGTV